jgi:hypothetical protein
MVHDRDGKTLATKNQARVSFYFHCMPMPMPMDRTTKQQVDDDLHIVIERS